MIVSFNCSQTKKLFDREKVPQWQSFEKQALRRLHAIDSAIALTDLLVPPGNQLESLKGDRLGQHSIRINKQWRICFVWEGGNARSVEIVDYH